MSERIKYNFEISGSGRRKSPATLTVNYTFSFNNNDEILYEGSKTYTGKIDENGDLENDINFVINETVTKRSADFVISADYNLSTSKNNVTFSQNSLNITEKVIPVRVWVEFNEYGELKAADLSGLVDGTFMFRDTNVGQITNEDGTIQSKTFDYDLSSLTDGNGMFSGCSQLISFSSDLPSLMNSEDMFTYCDNLTSFTSALPSLIYGGRMFEYCTNLTSFNADLDSLKSGYYMFHDCKLDAESLSYIANNINNLVERGYKIDNEDDWKYEVLGKIKTILNSYRGRIDIGHDTSIAPNVINECGSLLDSKGWTVYFNEKEFKKQ